MTAEDTGVSVRIREGSVPGQETLETYPGITGVTNGVWFNLHREYIPWSIMLHTSCLTVLSPLLLHPVGDGITLISAYINLHC